MRTTASLGQKSSFSRANRWSIAMDAWRVFSRLVQPTQDKLFSKVPGEELLNKKGCPNPIGQVLPPRLGIWHRHLASLPWPWTPAVSPVRGTQSRLRYDYTVDKNKHAHARIHTQARARKKRNSLAMPTSSLCARAALTRQAWAALPKQSACCGTKLVRHPSPSSPLSPSLPLLSLSRRTKRSPPLPLYPRRG